MNSSSINQSPPSPGRPERWSLELLYEMDWHRFRELVCRVVQRQGFGVSQISELADGVVLYAVTRRGRGGDPVALLQLPSWRDYSVDLPEAAGLRSLVAHLKAKRGIVVTPGHVTREAREYAAKQPLELVDGWQFLEWLDALPEEESRDFLKIATAGNWRVPLCPGCGGRMVLRERTEPAPEPESVGDLLIRESRILIVPVRCRKLVVEDGVEAHFRAGVVAEEAMIAGRAHLQLLCTGRVHLTPGAVLAGAVACRSLRLDPGGVLDADTRILKDGEWAADALSGKWFQQPARVWRCAAYQPCDVVLEAR